VRLERELPFEANVCESSIGPPRGPSDFVAELRDTARVVGFYVNRVSDLDALAVTARVIERLARSAIGVGRPALS